MRFKKSFGQNFLRDERFVRKVVSSMELNNDIIIEIGPGSGQITRYLMPKAKKLYCVEKDTSLINILKERFTPLEIERLSKDNLFSTTSPVRKSFLNGASLQDRSLTGFTSDSVEFINGDILTFDLSFLKEKAVIFGNVPFNISNRLIRYLVRNRNFIKKGYFTFQKEFVRKLAACPHKKEYGYMSCFIQYYADIKIIFDIPKESFYPKPEVDASFIGIKFFDNPRIKAKNEDFLFKLIRSAFSARRKKILNALSGFGNREYISKVLKSANIDGSLRPQDLSLKDYCDIAGVLEH